MTGDKSKKVKPLLLKGFKDYPAEDEFVRRELISKIQAVFEKHGYLPLQTPALEYIETLLGADYGQEAAGQIFHFVGPEETHMGLRFDLTAPLARYVASQPNLQLPLRRYQIAPVWRTDKPDPGRFREFLQFDLDIVGTNLMAADAEIIEVMVRTMQALGLDNFQVRYSNRHILNGLAQYAGLSSEQSLGMFRVLDKLEKQGRAAVIEELGAGRLDKSGDTIPGLNLNLDQITRIERFLNIPKDEFDEMVAFASEFIQEYPIAKQGLDEVTEIHNYLNSMGIDPRHATLDLSIVRGLGYYTGPIFETVLLDLPEYGSVFSGGRYDHLVERFSGQAVPGTGSSIGVDRLLAALKALQIVQGRKSASHIIVTTMDKERMSDYFRIASELREHGWNVDLFLGNNRRIPKQLQYADRLEIPVAVICGSDEFARGEVTIKNLRAGHEAAQDTENREEWLKAQGFQITVPHAEMILAIEKMLNSI